MPILLYCVGAICFAAGFAMAAYGIPVSEFSFGNTLIVAGTTLATGGLVIFALGAVVSKLQQLADTGALQMPASLPLASESLESMTPTRPAGGRGRVPFPPRPKTEPREELPPLAMPDMPRGLEPAVAAPTLPNPDEPSVTVAETVSYPPPEPASFGATETAPALDAEPKSAFDKEWPAPEPSPDRRSSLGFKWPERKPAKPIAEEEPVYAAESAEPAPEEPGGPAESEPEIETSRPAVLKSGVVDGMGYTLYVDGSIEAELPQGTLRFASINELREHLEQNS